MTKIVKVLFPTDFSDCSKEALRHAVRICKMFQARLDLIHVSVLHAEDPESHKKGFKETEKLIEDLEAQYEENMEDVRPIFKDHINLGTERLIKGFSAAEEILDTEKREGYDLIVMGTHGRGLFSKLVLGSEAEKVIRYSSCPVMTVNQEGRMMDILENYSRILVPFDFSDYSKKGLKYGIKLAQAFKAKLHVLHVFENYPTPLIYYYGVASMIEYNPAIEEKSSEIIEEAIREIDPDFKNYVPVITEGKPFKEIIKYAEKEDIDLLIQSTRGLGAIEAFFVGTTADKVIRKAACPVLSVKKNERDFVE